jgi:hypothetical protein
MRSTALPLNHWLARGLLALALLFAQQHAAVHWLAHAVGATHQKAPAPTGAEHCDECLTLSALGGAAASAAQTLPLFAAQHALPTLPAAADSPAALRLAFRSRAPPIFV